MKSKDTIAERVMEKLSGLPEHRLEEVLDFIEFLQTREYKQDDAILEVAGCISGTPLAARAIEEELYGGTEE